MKILSIKQALVYGISSVYTNIGYLVLAIAVVAAVNIAGALAFIGINWPTIAFFISKWQGSCSALLRGTMPSGPEFSICAAAFESANWLLYATLFLIGIIIVCLVYCYMTLGFINALLHLYDHKKGSFKALFVQPRLIFTFLVASILYTAMIILGTIALVVPGIILSIMFGMFCFVIVDKKAGIIESLRMSSHITYGAKWRLFFLILALAGIAVALGLGFNALSMLAANSQIFFAIITFVYQLLNGFWYLVSFSAGTYAYRTLNAQTYAPTHQ